MDDNTHKTRSANTLPPIKSLFTQSWQLLKSVLAPLIILNVIVIAVSIAAMLLMLVGFILLGLGAGFSGVFDFNPLSLGIGAVLSFLLFFIIITIISSIAQVGQIIILFEAKSRISVFSVLKRSARYIIPLLILGIVTSFFVFGGFFVFIIPAIIFSIFFSLSYFIVISENTGPLKALRRSVFIVKNNFSSFFLRMLALYGAFILMLIVMSIFTGILSTILDDEFGAIATRVISFVFQIGMSWYAGAYVIILFKQLQKANPQGESSLKIIFIISLIGWILSIVIGYFAIGGIIRLLELQRSNDFEKNLTPAEREELDQILKEIDSEFDIEDIEIEESTDSSEVTSPTPTAETI